ncbi:MAG TPA: tRNA 2-thiouridine(34) synthase MnmA, partial [Bacteroidales bacterium]|nr:tRNA 2-thiouridine(34) synthase MnmA [Bacteroidales bacterium]
MIPEKSHKIAVGLSGGVDSSVAALLLKRAGHDVFALFMQNWHDTTGTLHGDCEWEEDRYVAEMVAKKINIPFHFVDLSEIYRERVVDYMFSEYEKGRTPNPDVLCNREIKFDAFLKAALDLGADFVATGHYCRKDEFQDGHGNTIYRILSGKDSAKDQSYFLCQLNQHQLSRALFPIGDLLKSEVRKLAREAQLPSAEKKDSQGICFVGKVDLPLFLQQKIQPKEGDVVEIFREHYESLNEPESLEELSRPHFYTPSQGKVIGVHRGAYFYTIGQRKGLNIGGHKEPIFILSIDIDTNTI